MAEISKVLNRIDSVMAASHCKKHNADVGKPCWPLPIRNGQAQAAAVCGARVKRAGFNGGTMVAPTNQAPSARLK